MLPFEEIWSEAKDFTMLDEPRARFLYNACAAVENLPGDLLEVGTFRGGSALILSRCLPSHRVVTFDTFAGMPPTYFPVDGDYFQKRTFYETDLEKNCLKLLKNLDNVKICKAVFGPDSLAPLASSRIALLFYDGDLYIGAVDAIRFAYPRMPAGGILIFDDYDRQQCPGVSQAISDTLFCRGRCASEILHVDHGAKFAWLRKGEKLGSVSP